MFGSVRPSSVPMLDRKPSAATQAPPSVAISPAIAIRNAIDIARLRRARGLAPTVAVAAIGAATATAPAGPAGSGSVGGTLEFGIRNLEFGIGEVESGIGEVESGIAEVESGIAGGELEIGNLESGVWNLELERAFQVPNSEFQIRTVGGVAYSFRANGSRPDRNRSRSD